MAGLLGENWEDQQSQMMMGLAQGLLSARGSAGLSAGLGHMQAVQQNQSKEKLISAQLDNYRSEIEARKLAGVKDARMQKMQEAFMGGDGSPGAISPGAFAPSTDGMGPVMPMSAPQAQQGVQGGALAYARSIGIPEKALQADLTFNGGKGIADMMFKRGTPDMQVSNGYAYDKNGLGAGYLPSLSTSQDGKTSMVRIGPDGQPVVSAPEGALNTFNAYQGAAAGFKPIKVYNPETQREEFTSEGAVVGGQPGALPNSATAPGAWQAANPGKNMLTPRPGESDQPRIYAEALASAQQRLTQARTPDDVARARSDISGIQSEAQRSGAPAPLRAGGNFAAGPSSSEVATAEANKATLVDTAKADVMSTQGRQAGIDGALNAFKLVDQALLHPGISTATGLSGTIDPRNYIPGTDAKNYDALAKQLKGNAFLSAFASLKGAGAITEQEGEKATSALARLQQSQSTEEYKVALKDYQAVIGQGLKRMGVDPAKAHGASGVWGDKAQDAATPKVTTFDAKPPAHQFLGKTATGPDGKRYKSDGLIWKEVK